MKILLAAFIVTISLCCSKDKDKENPVLTITSPTLGQVVNAGDQIRVRGNVSDDKSVFEVHLIVTNAVDGATIIQIDDFPDVPSFDFNYLVGAATAGTHYRVQVIAKDRVKNDSRKTVEFTCN